MRKAREPVMRDQKAHRQQQEGPEGKWPPRSPFTIERQKSRARSAGRKRAPRRTLGRLPTALQIVVGRSSLLVQSRVKKFSLVHQDGRGRTGRAPNIPKRQFLWLSSQSLREVAAIIITYAEEAFRP